VIATPVSGFLSSEYGWPFAFYILGAVGVGTSIVAAFLGADYPSTHRMISLGEKQYIETSLGGAKEKVGMYLLVACQRYRTLLTFCFVFSQGAVPWKNIAHSVPYYALSCCHIFKTAIYATLLTEIPTFLATVLKFDIKEVCNT